MYSCNENNNWFSFFIAVMDKVKDKMCAEIVHIGKITEVFTSKSLSEVILYEEVPV